MVINHLLTGMILHWCRWHQFEPPAKKGAKQRLFSGDLLGIVHTGPSYYGDYFVNEIRILIQLWCGHSRAAQTTDSYRNKQLTCMRLGNVQYLLWGPVAFPSSKSLPGVAFCLAYVRAECPRWRTILMQSTVEYAVQYCLYKRKVAAQVEVLKYGHVDEAIGQGSMAGSSTSEEGLLRMRQIVERVGELGNGVVRTSDVTGLDWSVGPIGGSHGFMTILAARDPSPEFVAAVTACTWASYNSIYQIGSCLYGQTRLGTVQTGMLCTSQEGGAARQIDSILKGGVINMPDGTLKPAKPSISYSDDQVEAWGGPEGRKLDPCYKSTSSKARSPNPSGLNGKYEVVFSWLSCFWINPPWN